MNKFLVSLALLLVTITATAQTVTVKKQTEKVKNDNLEVYATTLDGKLEEVSGAFVRFLKSLGKLKQNTEPMALSEAVVNGTTYAGLVIYAQAKKINETTTAVWMGINPAEWSGNASKVNNDIEKTVYQFGVKYYRDKVQVQIDEAQQAFDAVEKQQQRTQNQYKDLTNKLTANEQEKIRLEKLLENNKLENASLKVRIEQNKKAQDSLANAAMQVQKALELHKEKQRKIN
jgi:predicted RNase H-like nuclease (RuvC/YqgF family)